MFIKNKNRTYLTIASISLLAACATPFPDYDGTAKRVAFANLCERQGLISYEAFSYYSSYQFGEYAKQWQVDSQRLQSMYFEEVKKFDGWTAQTPRIQEQLKLNCGQIATVAERVRPSNQVQTKPTEFTYKPPVTTNCVTMMGTTRCTTY